MLDPAQDNALSVPGLIGKADACKAVEQSGESDTHLQKSERRTEAVAYVAAERQMAGFLAPDVQRLRMVEFLGVAVRCADS